MAIPAYRRTLNRPGLVRVLFGDRRSKMFSVAKAIEASGAAVLVTLAGEDDPLLHEYHWRLGGRDVMACQYGEVDGGERVVQWFCGMLARTAASAEVLTRYGEDGVVIARPSESMLWYVSLHCDMLLGMKPHMRRPYYFEYVPFDLRKMVVALYRERTQ